MKIWRPIFCVIALSSFTVVFAQERANRLTIESFRNDVPGNCESNIAVLDSLAQRTGADELIIVIARLGNNENRNRLNYRRLHNVRAYLTGYFTDPTVRRRMETIITAEGERVSGYGRIELYANGRLFWVLKVRHNSDLPVGNCGREPPAEPCPPEERNLFPCLDRRRRQ